MSRLIKSSRIVLGEESFKISSEITLPVRPHDTHPQAVMADLDAEDMQDYDQGQFDDAYTPESLIEQAEQTALGILDQAQAEADDIVLKAQQTALQIEEEAMNKAKDLYASTKEEAHQEGYSQGYQKAEHDAQLLIDDALTLKEEWRFKQRQVVEQLEGEAVDLILQTLNRVFSDHKLSTDYLLPLIKKGFEHIAYTHQVAVRVSEEDYAYVLDNKKKIMAMMEQIDTLEIKQDAALSRGDCVVETDAGMVDIGLDTQFDQVKRLFEELLHSE